METIQNGLERISTPIGTSETTGLEVYESYTANSGFNYMVGVREVQDLLIVEQIAEGTGTTLLCGILICHKEKKTLLKEITVERNVRYSRQLVMEMVQNAILELFRDSMSKEALDVDLEAANVYINDVLDRCYFESSRKVFIEWARSLGIIKN